MLVVVVIVTVIVVVIVIVIVIVIVTVIVLILVITGPSQPHRPPRLWRGLPGNYLHSYFSSDFDLDKYVISYDEQAANITQTCDS